MSGPLKRSHEPIFWLLFGAGGMLAALIGAMLVFITCFAEPLGVLPPETFAYANMQGFARHLLGKAAIVVVVSLLFWHAVHRIFHSLHDLGIHAGTKARLACYGTAAVATILVVWAVLAIGF